MLKRCEARLQFEERTFARDPIPPCGVFPLELSVRGHFVECCANHDCVSLCVYEVCFSFMSPPLDRLRRFAIGQVQSHLAETLTRPIFPAFQ
jgi:hypothetical protein